MAAILVGIGGTGGEIVNEVRKRVDFAVTTAGDTIAAAQQRNEIRYFLVDTRSEDFQTSFPPTSIFDIPRAGQKHDIDRRVAGIWRDGQDPFFLRWWPKTGNDTPYLPGDFNEGAGQVRIKGKLAYYFHLLQPDGPSLAIAVQNTVSELMSALGPAAEEESRRIPIYLIGSLGGGTGSGMMLAVAQHLKMELRLNADCELRGVFVLASITQQAPHTADRASIWANTDAALREIDYFQIADDPKKIHPFLRWPGPDNQIPAADEPYQTPFRYCYLFGARNRVNLTLPTFPDYIRLIAECLVSEIMGPLDQEIKGPHAQFVQWFTSLREIHGRPTCYASAARADIIYPVERIERHLGRRFSARLIGARLQPPEVGTDVQRQGVELAEAFLTSNGLMWSVGHTLQQVLQGYDVPQSEDEEPERPESVDGEIEVTAAETTEATTFEEREPLPDREELADTQWKKAGREKALRLAEEWKQETEQWRVNALIPYLKARVNDLRAEHCGPDGKILGFIDRVLQAENGEGYLRARAAIGYLHETLAEQNRLVQLAIKGDPPSKGIDREPGLMKTADTLKKEYEDRRDALHNSFTWWRKGMKLIGAGNGSGSGKETFINEWADPWRVAERDYQIHLHGAQIYQQMISTVDRLMEIFREFDEEFRRAANQLTTGAGSDLGTSGQGETLEIALLDHPDLVDFHFAGQVENAIRVSGGSMMRGLLTGDGEVRSALHHAFGRPMSVNGDSLGSTTSLGERVGRILLSQSQELFGAIVRDTTIWHAIVADFRARRANPAHITPAVKAAERAVSIRAGQLDERGVDILGTNRELLQAYIYQLIKTFQRRARPFWQVDQTKLDRFAPPGLQLPYRGLTVLAYDQTAYKQFLNEGDFKEDFMATVGQRMEMRPTDLKGKYVIRLYMREGVIPLFFLSDGELRELQKGARQVSADKPLYADRRFDRALDPRVAPVRIEETASLLRYVLASAFLFRELDVRTTASNNGHGSMRTIQLTPHRNGGASASMPFADFDTFQAALAKDSDLYERLRSRVDVRWEEEVRIGNAATRIDSMIAEAERLIDDADPVDQDWWSEAVSALRRRAEQREYRIRAYPIHDRPRAGGTSTEDTYTTEEDPFTTDEDADATREANGAPEPNGAAEAKSSHRPGASRGRANATTRTRPRRVIRRGTPPSAPEGQAKSA